MLNKLAKNSTCWVQLRKTEEKSELIT